MSEYPYDDDDFNNEPDDLGEYDDGYDDILDDDDDPSSQDENTYPDFNVFNHNKDDEDDEDSDKGDKKDKTKPNENAEDIEKKAKDIENKAKNASKGGKGVAKTGKIASSARKVGSFFVTIFTPPILWITLVVLLFILILLLILIIVPAIAGAPYENVNLDNGVFDTSQGIMGDKFYGVRIIYKDDERAVKDLETYYENLSTNFLGNVGNYDGVNLILSLNYTEERPEEVTALIKIMANVIDNSDEDLSLAESLALIDHFGYTEYELDTICAKFKEYIIANVDSYYTFDGYSGNFEDDLDYAFNINYENLNTISQLYYVKDIILPENAMISGLTQENYVAVIYMPKTTVTLKEADYMFYIPKDTENASIDFKMISVNNGSETIITESQVDPSWWGNDSAETISESGKIKLELNKFNSLDPENPILGKSIYSLIYDFEYLSLQKDNIANLFKIGTITANDGSSYDELNYLPIDDTTYFYITFNANCKFQFCEHSVDYD